LISSFLIYASAGSCYAQIDQEGKCSDLVANDVTKEDCCSNLGMAYNDAITSEKIFMVLSGMKRENCNPCKGKLNCFLFYQIINLKTFRVNMRKFQVRSWQALHSQKGSTQVYLRAEL
jgi:hypothetical protein